MIPRLFYIASHIEGTDPAWTLDTLTAVLAAGVPAVQFRTKDLADAVRLDLAREVVRRCRAAGAVSIVNDRVDIALAAAADGVHVGPDDLPPAVARSLLGPDLILGASARTSERVSEAVAAGASYIGVGPCYSTSSKAGLPDPIGPDGLGVVARGVNLPVIAIGGITPDRVPEVLAAGAHGVAVIGGIAGAGDPAEAARAYMQALGAA